MGDKTDIEWTDATWNPTTGCTHVSAGCDHCYAETLAARLQKMSAAGYENGFEFTQHPTRLDMPLRWKRPRKIFVNSMSDLFHEKAEFAFIADVFRTMLDAHWHTFQVLTKRPGKARSWVAQICDYFDIEELPPHIWMGTSVENDAVRFRISELLLTRASRRFLSCEPLIGPLDLQPYLWEDAGPEWAGKYPAPLHWVIVGAESGHGARPMDEDWVRKLRDACVAAGTAFFYKQKLGPTGKKVGTPMLDGRTWEEFPPQYDAEEANDE